MRTTHNNQHRLQVKLRLAAAETNLQVSATRFFAFTTS